MEELYQRFRKRWREFENNTAKNAQVTLCFLGLTVCILLMCIGVGE